MGSKNSSGQNGDSSKDVAETNGQDRYKILFADDSPIMRSCIRRTVESIPGCSICGEAADGIEAVESTRKLMPDLIILDLSMPRMSGLEAARTLRTMGVQTPIILFTLHASAISPSQVSELGIDAVVQKIGDEAVLVSHVQRLLSIGRAGLSPDLPGFYSSPPDTTPPPSEQ